MSIPDAYYTKPLKPDWTTKVRGPIHEAVLKIKKKRASRGEQPSAQPIAT